MKAKVTVWFPGGTNTRMPVEDALKIAEALWAADTGFQWEIREAGTDKEKTWDGEHEAAKLGTAVNRVIPCWGELGMSHTQAAVIAMDTGLVVSTGIQVEDDGES